MLKLQEDINNFEFVTEKFCIVCKNRPHWTILKIVLFAKGVWGYCDY